MTNVTHGLALRSTVHDDGRVEMAVTEESVTQPGSDEILVRVEAAPINPSDLGMMFAGAKLDAVEPGGDSSAPSVIAPLSPGALAAVSARVGRPMPCGNEGAGVVIAAGDDPAAQALLGRTVAFLGGAMYAQYRTIPAAAALVLAEGTDPRDAASCFVNPLTALGMVETMRRENHTALVHTAAASNLGQMLNRICLAEGVELVSIVRRPEQADLLRSQGATHVVDSSAASFHDDLIAALTETGATIAFDATGGGELASDILRSMEAASSARESGGEYSRYGSTTHKQVYIYGGLDRSPTLLNRQFGMAWSVGGWLLPPFMESIGTERAGELRQRVADELTTTFASGYTAEVSLADAVDPDRVRQYGAMSTGEKVLVTPHA